MFKEFLRKTAGLVCLFTLAAPHLLKPLLPDDSQGGTDHEVRYIEEFSENDLMFGKFDGYDKISMKVAGYLSKLAEPVLPVETVILAIPPGTRAVRVDARSLNSIEIPGRFDILPGQPPLRTSESSYRLTVEPDYEVYSSTLPYPGNLGSLEHEGDLAGQVSVWLNVYPPQYIPV